MQAPGAISSGAERRALDASSRAQPYARAEPRALGARRRVEVDAEPRANRAIAGFGVFLPPRLALRFNRAFQGLPACLCCSPPPPLAPRDVHATSLQNRSASPISPPPRSSSPSSLRLIAFSPPSFPLLFPRPSSSSQQSSCHLVITAYDSIYPDAELGPEQSSEKEKERKETKDST